MVTGTGGVFIMEEQITQGQIYVTYNGITAPEVMFQSSSTAISVTKNAGGIQISRNTPMATPFELITVTASTIQGLIRTFEVLVWRPAVTPTPDLLVVSSVTGVTGGLSGIDMAGAVTSGTVNVAITGFDSFIIHGAQVLNTPHATASAVANQITLTRAATTINTDVHATLRVFLTPTMHRDIPFTIRANGSIVVPPEGYSLSEMTGLTGDLTGLVWNGTVRTASMRVLRDTPGGTPGFQSARYDIGHDSLGTIQRQGNFLEFRRVDTIFEDHEDTLILTANAGWGGVVLHIPILIEKCTLAAPELSVSHMVGVTGDIDRVALPVGVNEGSFRLSANRGSITITNVAVTGTTLVTAVRSNAQPNQVNIERVGDVTIQTNATLVITLNDADVSGRIVEIPFRLMVPPPAPVPSVTNPVGVTGTVAQLELPANISEGWFSLIADRGEIIVTNVAVSGAPMLAANMAQGMPNRINLTRTGEVPVLTNGTINVTYTDADGPGRLLAIPIRLISTDVTPITITLGSLTGVTGTITGLELPAATNSASFRVNASRGELQITNVSISGTTAANVMVAIGTTNQVNINRVSPVTTDTDAVITINYNTADENGLVAQVPIKLITPVAPFNPADIKIVDVHNGEFKDGEIIMPAGVTQITVVVGHPNEDWEARSLLLVGSHAFTVSHHPGNPNWITITRQQASSGTLEATLRVFHTATQFVTFPVKATAEDKLIVTAATQFVQNAEGVYVLPANMTGGTIQFRFDDNRPVNTALANVAWESHASAFDVTATASGLTAWASITRKGNISQDVNGVLTIVVDGIIAEVPIRILANDTGVGVLRLVQPQGIELVGSPSVVHMGSSVTNGSFRVERTDGGTIETFTANVETTNIVTVTTGANHSVIITRVGPLTGTLNTVMTISVNNTLFEIPLVVHPSGNVADNYDFAIEIIGEGVQKDALNRWIVPSTTELLSLRVTSTSAARTFAFVTESNYVSSIAPIELGASDIQGSSAFTRTVTSTNTEVKLQVWYMRDGVLTRAANDVTLMLQAPGTSAGTGLAGFTYTLVEPNVMRVRVPQGYQVNQGNQLYIPLISMLTGSRATVTVANMNEGARITGGTYEFAVPGSAGTKTTVSELISFVRAPGELANIIITENRPGVITEGELRLSLSTDFRFESTSMTVIFGGSLAGQFTVGTITARDNLIIIPITERAGAPERTLHVGTIEVRGLTVRPADRYTDYGNVNMRVSGVGTTTQNVTVARYVADGVSIFLDEEYIEDLPILVPGLYPSELDHEEIMGAPFTIEEAVADAMSRTITLTFPDGVLVRALAVLESANVAEFNEVDFYFNRNDPEADSQGLFVIRDNVIQLRVPPTIDESRGFSVTVQPVLSICPTFDDDEIIVSLTNLTNITANEDGNNSNNELVIAEVQQPVKITAKSSVIRTDPRGVTLGDITIRETDAATIRRGNSDGVVNMFTRPRFVREEFTGNHIVVAIENFNIDSVGGVSVRDGNINVTHRVEGGVLIIVPSRTSSRASEIVITGIKGHMASGNTVPDGGLSLFVGGNALVQNFYDGSRREIHSTFDTPGFVYERYIVNKESDLPENQTTDGDTSAGSILAVLQLDSNIITLGTGQTITMDARPVIENDRVLLPIRFMANAIGITDNQILWNDAWRTVIITTGTTVLQIRIDEEVLYRTNLTDGTVSRVQLHVPARIVNDRTMLPLRNVAEALDIEIEYDEVTRTATLKRK
jgi:hypothetical protein